MLNTRFYNSILAVSIAAALAACGGGGGSSSDGVKPVTEKNGRAVDGPLAGSLVVFEDCQNQTTQTDAQGYFKFPLGCSSSSIRISGGLDTATNLAFSSTLKAPKSNSNDVISWDMFATLCSTVIVEILSFLYLISTVPVRATLVVFSLA